MFHRNTIGQLWKPCLNHLDSNSGLKKLGTPRFSTQNFSKTFIVTICITLASNNNEYIEMIIIEQTFLNIHHRFFHWAFIKHTWRPLQNSYGN